MEISMFDVNFGEAIIYDDRGSRLLVDCGAKFYGKGLDAYYAIKGHFVKGKDDVMITHFDEDHYNGLIEMAKDGGKVRRLYVPKYIKKNGSVKYTDNYFVDQLRSIMFLYVLGRKERLDTLKKLFIAMINLTKPTCCIKSVAYGDQVKVGISRFDILWPEEAYNTLYRTISDDNYRNISDDIRNICVYELDRSGQGHRIEEIDDVINQYIDVFTRFYLNIDDSEGEEEVRSEDQFISLRDDFIRAHYMLERAERTISISLPQRETKQVDSLANTLIKTQNECSIVFSNRQDILALGDASPRVVKYLYSKARIKKQYKYLKAPHHGTKLYYTDDLPDSNIVFISNSGRRYMNWKIAKEYFSRFNCRVMCTNNVPERCEYFLLHDDPGFREYVLSRSVLGGYFEACCREGNYCSRLYKFPCCFACCLKKIYRPNPIRVTI